VQVHERRAVGARLDVPTTWITLDRTAEHATWGTADRRHTVTLARTESSGASLPGVVSGSVAASTRALPGADLVGMPVAIDLTDAARPGPGDSAMLVRFRVRAQGREGALLVEQVWRRDARAGMDVVATWTSADGAWPVSPRSAIPRSDASR
jgi:hypothetical protein